MCRPRSFETSRSKTTQYPRIRDARQLADLPRRLGVLAAGDRLRASARAAARWSGTGVLARRFFGAAFFVGDFLGVGFLLRTDFFGVETLPALVARAELLRVARLGMVSSVNARRSGRLGQRRSGAAWIANRSRFPRCILADTLLRNTTTAKEAQDRFCQVINIGG